MRILKFIIVFCIIVPQYGASRSIPKGEKQAFCTHSVELETPSHLDGLIELGKASKLVLLGEATHGTAEFYRWRAEISKRLIVEENFNFIAVEGDWAPIYKLNLYVKGLLDGYPSAAHVLQEITRWPQWMWKNTEVLELAEWLKKHNANKPMKERVGIYGMDVYGQWDAMSEVLTTCSNLLPFYHDEIKEKFGCYAAYDFDEWKYAEAVANGYPSCYDQLQWVADVILKHFDIDSNYTVQKQLLHAWQCAQVVKNSEEFYRLGVTNGAASWNSRVNHMHQSVQLLLQLYGEDSKGIVWAHNTHIGDARATAMGQHGMFSIGEKSRQAHSMDNVTLIGFTTFKGMVNAGLSWGAPMQTFKIPKAKRGSLEYSLEKCGFNALYLIFDDQFQNSQTVITPTEHRAIGVVYNPWEERTQNYDMSILHRRFDAIVFVKETSPLQLVD